MYSRVHSGSALHFSSHCALRSEFPKKSIEERGACSVKHALIAALAEEHKIPLTLMLGIFFLTAENMPKIIPILDSYHLEAIPEAHCYLKYNHYTLDITFPDIAEFSFNPNLEQEITIPPSKLDHLKWNNIKRLFENG